MVSEFVILVIILWLWYSTALRARDLLSAFATATGLGLFLAFSAGSPGTASPRDGRWLIVGVITAGIMALFVVLGSSGSAWRRALLLGAGASVGFALLAALTKTFTNVLLSGWGAAFSSWPSTRSPHRLGSFVVMQSAFQVGPLAASQSSLILVNPLVSIIIGHALFHETLRGGPLFVTLELFSLAIMVAGASACARRRSSLRCMTRRRMTITSRAAGATSGGAKPGSSCPNHVLTVVADSETT